MKTNRHETTVIGADLAQPTRPSSIRRRLLQVIAAIPVFVAGAWPRRALAERPAAAFAAGNLAAAIQELYGDQPAQPDPRVSITVAGFVDNGAVVPIEVAVAAVAVRAIALFAADNPVPLLGRFEFGEHVEAFIGTRIKLAKSTRVVAIAETTAGLLVGERQVGVGKGGCG